jgi:decaprenylphospho-beta-D-erythro-pentofuranosid-2-ulose 2-reductase
MTRVAIFGATSAIARESARAWARDGAHLALVGRDEARVEALTSDLRVRGARTVVHFAADSSQSGSQQPLIDDVHARLGGIDVALIAFGTLPDPARAESDMDYAEESLRVNFMGAAMLAARLANYMEHNGGGVIAVISSVAGDRGRGSNPFYGAAKGGLSTIASGLRSRYSGRGVHVLTVKPGFVETPMTAHIVPNVLFVKPDFVGRAIIRAVRARRDVIYVPWFWRWIMLVIRAVPERLFKKLTL